MLLSIMIRFYKLFENNINTYLMFKNNNIIGNLKLYNGDSRAIITDFTISKNMRNLGYGTKFLNFIENHEVKYDDIYINLWSLDRCYFNYYSYFNKRGYNPISYSKLEINDNGDNIYYNLNLVKNK